MRKHFFPVSNFKHIFLVSLFAFTSATVAAQQCQSPIWSDEFNGVSVDTTNWDIQIGDGCDQGPGMCGWGNSELQNYQSDNIFIVDGVLQIEARKERVKAAKYTSGRMRTYNMPGSGEWSFGRFEARMKVPSGDGSWPAFWMLPTDPLEGWPVSGEIDIMETVGRSTNLAYGSVHFGQPWPDNKHAGAGMLQQPGKWSDNFHTYAMEWESGEIRWYVDNMLYSTKTAADLAPEDFPFDGRNDFHIILNLAIGGSWGGVVDDSAFPQALEVDFVRVYSGFQPNLSGNHLPSPGATETYSVVNPAGSTTWSVTGGTISGSGSSVDVTWDVGSAGTTQTLTAISGGCEVTTNIYVGQSLSTETVLEDFNGTQNMTVTSSNGIYDTTSQPGVLTYTRDSASQWDVITASTSAIPDVGPFVLGEKAFSIEFNNTDASLIGKKILIQLENSSVATDTNFPSGRHSAYEAFIKHADGAQVLRFTMIDRHDSDTADNVVDSIVFLIEPDAFTGDTYILDNIEILGQGGTPPTENNAPTASFTDSCTDLTCDFTSTSTDSDGSIVSWAWDFSDGTASTENPSHTFSAAGTYTISLTVTDNEGATDVATADVTVGGSSGEATITLVSSVVTGIQNAGRGQKLGQATVTVLDDTGAPVANANVTGNFSGTWNESGSATTDSNGVATIVTSSSQSGGVNVNFCVSTVSNTALPFDAAASSGMCQ